MRLNHLALLLPLIISGCASINSSPKEEKHKMELTLTKLRSEIEELRHDLNSHQMEMHILEGKITSQDSAIAHIKSQSVELQQMRIDQLVADVTQLEKQTARQTKKQDEIMSDIRQLSLHANQATAALAQYKEKISELERTIGDQNHQLAAEIAKFQASLKQLASLEASSTESPMISYTVQAGDTLEKIARRFKTSPTELLRSNQLEDQNKLFIGQVIVVPKS